MWHDSPHEECGVFGIYARNENVSQLTFFGLHALQHRGQESAGIAVSNGYTIDVVKQMGLIAQVFDEHTLESLKGHIAVGHTRYSTTGSSKLLNVQPMVMETSLGQFAICHNGNLTNAVRLREEVLRRGAALTTSSDTEIAALLLGGGPFETWEEQIKCFMHTVEGAYSLIILTQEALYAIRDPWGLRPLCLGRLAHNGWVVASESCALDAIGAEFIREVAPGEALRISDCGYEGVCSYPAPRPALCLFEYIYFARSDSVIQDQLVHQVRVESGRELAREAPAVADLVFGVPDSAIPAAIGYAEVSGIPYGEGLTKDRYIGRTFIQPNPRLRQQGIALKLKPLRQVIKGKRVVVVDDSIVRGNTSGPIIALLRQAGAREIHMRISSPPIRHPCFMGVDIPDTDELIAHHSSTESICAQIGADSLAYLSYDGLMRAIGQDPNRFCGACFTGNYPFTIRDVQHKSVFEQKLHVDAH